MFPEVIIVDTVFSTNNESRPLLTIGDKDSMGKMFIILRAFLPHEQSWGFRWVFSIVLPTMISQHTLQRVQLFISDGDSQEFGQIDNAIIIFSPTLHVGDVDGI